MKRDFVALDGAFDLLVCGGGIYGAWTAYDAALRGLRVALVEQGDWASGTSSASTKLIHGGLRYLEMYDFELVKKALRERQRLLQMAPHRVWPLRFGVPVYEHSRNGMLKLGAGLMLYDMLAGFPGETMQHSRFDREAFATRFPVLDPTGLKGGFTYGDAQTDDARLVLELVYGAQVAGAVCVNYARRTAWDEAQGRVCGATVRDGVSGATLQVRARRCVNAAGQWLSRGAEEREWCRLTKGVHLVMPALPCNEALLLTAQDGRAFFLIPWQGRTLLGATDTDFRGDVDVAAVEESDVDYLLAAANRYLSVPWRREDVIGSYAGLRTMRQQDKAAPSDVSRDWELKTDAGGVLHSVGGKITSAREDAAVIVDTACAGLGIRAACATAERPLPWKPRQDFVPWLEEMGARAQALGIDAQSAENLLRRHGERGAEVLQQMQARPELAARIVPDLPFIAADLLFCARNEMVVYPDDLLRRRLPLDILSGLDGRLLRQIAMDLTGLPQ